MTRKPKSYDIPIDGGGKGAPSAKHAAAGAAPPGGGAGRGERESSGSDSGRTAPPAEEAAGVEKEYGEAIDHLRRLQAEFSNYRRRTERERLETAAWAQGMLVEKLLPVMDDFDRAVASLQREGDPHLQGFAMIREKLFRSLTEAGLERIEAEGEPFDPDLHEALMTQEVEPERAGRVLAEIEPGYLFKGKLVRPARVQVGVSADEG